MWRVLIKANPDAYTLTRLVKQMCEISDYSVPTTKNRWLILMFLYLN